MILERPVEVRYFVRTMVARKKCCTHIFAQYLQPAVHVPHKSQGLIDDKRDIVAKNFHGRKTVFWYVELQQMIPEQKRDLPDFRA